MATWPDRWPGRLEYEVEDFCDRGLEFALDEELVHRGGPVVMRGRIERHGTPVELEVVYPDTFPFLRPEVLARDLSLGRHQNPYEGNLCLLDRATRAWDTDWTAARLIEERVPLLLDLLEEGGQALREGEALQGEPASAFFVHQPGTAIFVPGALLRIPTTIKHGSARLSFAEQEPAAVLVRALLSRAQARVRKRWRDVGRADDALLARFSGGSSIEISWARLTELPPGRSPEELLAAAEAAVPGVRARRCTEVAGGDIAVTGCLFEEEVRQGEYADAWLFVVEVKTADGGGAYVVRGERLTPEDLSSRIPTLAPLRERTVALTGLGALGGPVALELARAQLGRLRVLDQDLLEVGNLVRWPTGLRAVGHSKASVIEGTIVGDYPFTAVEAIEHQIGRAVIEDEIREPEMTALERFIENADLLVDATAEIGIGQLLAHIADGYGISQVYVWATEGALGGGIARVVPGGTGCWFCLRLHLERGTIPMPPREETGTVQPRGCATPTFTGANFDLLPLVAQATRMAAELLVEPGRVGEDVAIMSFKDGDAHLAAPQWTSFDLSRHSDCPVCAARAA